MNFCDSSSAKNRISNPLTSLASYLNIADFVCFLLYHAVFNYKTAVTILDVSCTTCFCSSNAERCITNMQPRNGNDALSSSNCRSASSFVQLIVVKLISVL